MVTTKQRPMGHYIERMKAHLLRRYPHLKFRTVVDDDRDATIYYQPYSEEDDYDIIHRVGGIATEALVDGGYRIWLMPE